MSSPRREFDARELRFGRFYEDFEAGDVYRHWPGKTITEAEDHLFCLLTMAASPVHIDAHFAAEEMPEGRNVVVGTFVYALVLGMSVPDVSGKALYNLGVENMRHVLPVYHGDTLYARSEIAHKRLSGSRPGTGIVTVESVGENQDGAVVCAFRRSVLVPCRPASEG